MNHGRQSATHNLAPWAVLAYAAVLIYASLHPMDTMRWTEANPLAFIDRSRLLWAAGKPYGMGSFDAFSNWAAYIPLGLGAALWLRSRFKGPWHSLAALVLGAGLSLSLEALQTYNPLRVPSLWDVLTNTVGASCGVGLAWMLGKTKLSIERLNLPIAPHAGAIWAVLGLWCLAQLHPQSWVFMTASMQQVLGPSLPATPLTDFSPQGLAKLETLAATLALLACLGVVRLGTAFRQHRRGAQALWMLVAWLLIITWQWLAYLLQYGPAITPALWGQGVWLACGIAAVAAWVLAYLPHLACGTLTVAILSAYLTLAQWLPPHPYATSASVWQYGQFTHLFGLTGLISALWPLLALLAIGLQLRYVGRR